MATPAEERTKRLAAVSTGAWLVASMGSLALLGQMTDHFEAQYDGLELAVPRATAAIIELGPYLRHPACPVLVVAAGLVPFFLAGRSMRTARGYLVATATVILLTGIACSVLYAPLRAYEEKAVPIGPIGPVISGSR